MRARLTDHASHGLQRPAATANEEPRLQHEQSNRAKRSQPAWPSDDRLIDDEIRYDRLRLISYRTFLFFSGATNTECTETYLLTIRQ
jgi:hypothetical protein